MRAAGPRACAPPSRRRARSPRSRRRVLDRARRAARAPPRRAAAARRRAAVGVGSEARARASTAVRPRRSSPRAAARPRRLRRRARRVRDGPTAALASASLGVARTSRVGSSGVVLGRPRPARRGSRRSDRPCAAAGSRRGRAGRRSRAGRRAGLPQARSARVLPCWCFSFVLDGAVGVPRALDSGRHPYVLQPSGLPRSARDGS